jgi:hypothetical protein
MLPIKKIYIDSRYKSSDSRSHSDFSIDLPQTFLMPEDTGFYIDDVCIPHSWYPIERNVNNYIIVAIDTQQLAIELDPGMYTVQDLNTHIVAKMNGRITGNKFSSSWNQKENTIGINIASGSTVSIPTDSEITDPLYKSRNINHILKNYTSGKTYNSSNPFKSGQVDLNPLRNIYMSASGLGNFNTITVSGNRNVVKKIPVNAPHGSIIFDQTVTGMDYIDCSHQTLSRISFQLRDVFGNLIDLHDNHISFSIVFSRVQDGS